MAKSKKVKKVVNDNNIETVVLKCFIRVIKDNGYYMLYRRGVSNTGVMKRLINNAARSDSPFYTSTSTGDVIRSLVDITKKMLASNGKGSINDVDRYEHVTMTINHLLHFFIEVSGVGMQTLCNLGEEIYALSCNKLFGDSLEDIEEHDEKIEEMEDIGKIKAKLFQNYVNDLSSGKISHSVSFDQYFAEESKKLKNLEYLDKKMFGQPNPQDVGIMLGEMPDGRHGWIDNFDDDDEHHF